MVKATLSTNLIQAIHNNAVWCDTICRAHGIPGEFHTHVWLNRKPVPPYYPNAVTLSGKPGIADQMRAIQNLIGDESSAGLAVKDSFDLLDLAPFGFHALFEAMWIWRAPLMPIPTTISDRIQFTIVQQPDELAQWETAWAGFPANEKLTPEKRIFLPYLLADRDVMFIAAYRDQQLVGGAIANCTGDVVGISNQFAPSGEAAIYWTGCIATMMSKYPDRPIVGYERGTDLELAQRLGFEAIRPLRVWVRAGSSM
jgi:hypothetical protein